MNFRDAPTRGRVRRKSDGAMGSIEGRSGRMVAGHRRSSDTRVAAYIVKWDHDDSRSQIAPDELESLTPGLRLE